MVSEPLDPLQRGRQGAGRASPPPVPRHGGSDNVNTNVVGIAGRTFALVEAGSYPVELSDTLDEQTYNPFDDTLMGSFTAHPHLDPLTGEQHAIAYEATDPDTVRHVVISPEGKVVRELPIKVKHGPSIHDCAITARYALILDLPVTFSMKSLIAGHSFPYRWNPEHQARIGLLPRTGHAEETIWIDVPPCYIFHVANAFDLPDGRVVLDAVVYDTMFADSTLGPDAIVARPGALDDRPHRPHRRAPHHRRHAAGIPPPRRTPFRPGLSLRLHHGAARAGRGVHRRRTSC